MHPIGLLSIKTVSDSSPEYHFEDIVQCTFKKVTTSNFGLQIDKEQNSSSFSLILRQNLTLIGADFFGS